MGADLDRKGGWRTIGCGCCAGFLLVGFLCVLALVVGTRRVARQVIAEDITEYVRIVEEADIEEGARDALLDQLERIRARARRGEVGFFSWLGYEESLEDLVEDGTLSDRDAAALRRQLDQLEDELDPPRGEAPEETPVEAEPGETLVDAPDDGQLAPRPPSGVGIVDLCAGPRGSTLVLGLG